MRHLACLGIKLGWEGGVGTLWIVPEVRASLDSEDPPQMLDAM